MKRIAGRFGPLLPGIAILIAFAIAFPNPYTLHFDEQFSAYWVLRPLHEIIFPGIWEESSPPFYYAVLKIWSEIFGRSEAALRSLSVVAACFAVVVAALLGVRVGGRTVGVVSGAVVALLPILCLYAQDARPVAFLPFLKGLVILACIAELQAMSRPHGAGGTGHQRTMASAIILASSCILAIYTSPLSGIFVAATFLVLGLLAVVCPDLGKRSLLRWSTIAAFIFLASIPAAAALVLNARAGAHDWMGPWNLREAARIALNTLLGESAHGWPVTIRFLIASIFAAIAAFGIITLPRRIAAVMTGIPLLFIIFIFLISSISRVAQPRYLLGATVPFAVLLSVGTLALSSSRRIRMLMSAALIGALAILSTRQALRETRGEWQPSTDWRSLTAALMNNESCRGPVYSRTAVGLAAWPYYGDLGMAPRYRI